MKSLKTCFAAFAVAAAGEIVHKAELLGPLPAHQVEIAFVIAVAERFCPVKHSSLHLKGVIIHHAQVLCDLSAVFLRSQFADAALFMRDVVLILPRYGLKIIKPVHRVFFNMIS